VLIGAYDDEHYPMGETGTPQAIVAFMLEQHGMTRADLTSILGGRSRVSEFFSGKRRLSVPQIVKLREVLRVPADLLLGADGSKETRKLAREARLQAGSIKSRTKRRA
jgi:HTH-type transcriptional regulator/antitoxin HigA